MRDPRTYGVSRRLRDVGRIMSIVSGKGGVGKSTISSILALVLRDHGYSVGLLDLDFHGPSCHEILGIESFSYEEERGIKPYMYNGIAFASIYPFVREEYVTLRGVDVSNALIEFMAIINWGRLDFLIMDMPPGMGDPLLDIARLVERAEYIVVSSSSRLSISTVARLVRFLRKFNYNIVGIIENMVRGEKRNAVSLAEEYGVRYLCSIPYDENLEEAIGDIGKLRKTLVWDVLAGEALPVITRHAYNQETTL